MTSGFCTVESTNVAATFDRRCPNDNSLVIAPSTLCAHRQWIGDDWSECLQERPCPPRAADEWRKMLGQQAAAVKKRDKDRAARQAAARAPATSPGPRHCSDCRTSFRAPKINPDARQCAICRDPRKPPEAKARQERAIRKHRPRIERPCAHCRALFRPRKQTARFCSVACCRADRASTRITPSGARWLTPIPCPVCSTPFKPSSMGADKPRRQTCSVACGRRQSARTQTMLPRVTCPTCCRAIAPESIGRSGRRRRFCSWACYQQSDTRRRGKRGRWATEIPAEMAS